MNAPAPSADRRPRTAVMIRDVGMGDLVWHVPYFRRIAETSSDGQVTVIAPPSTLARDLLGHEPWAREVLYYDRRPRRDENRRGEHASLLGLARMSAELRSRRLDRIALFTTRPLRAVLACLGAGIPRRLGYGTTWLQRRLLTRTRWITAYRGPAVATYKDASAFCMAQGWCDAPLVPRLTVRADALARMQALLAPLPRPLVALSIGTSEAFKQWGEANFAALATLLAERGQGVLVLGGPAESALAEAIVARIAPALRERVVAITRGSVADTVAALSLADACVGNDTGATNIAAAVSTPTFVLLGPRPILDHDPDTLHLLRADRLEDIGATDVVRALSAVLEP